MAANQGRLVVVGGGLSGLSAALAWTKNRPDNPALVLERQDKVGGYVTSYRRRGFTFDTVQMMPDVKEVLEYLGIEIELLRFGADLIRLFIVDPRSKQVLRTHSIPADGAKWLEGLCRQSPQSAKALAQFFEQSLQMYLAFQKLKVAPGIWDGLTTLVRHFAVVHNSMRSFESYLKAKGIVDEQVIEQLNVFVEMSALPADKVCSLVPIAVMHSLLLGACRPCGGFDQLPGELLNSLDRCGATVRTGARVEKILQKEGGVTGVRLVGGEEIAADHVVTAVGTGVAFQDLLGMDVLRQQDAEYCDRAQRVRLSYSSININLGLDHNYDLERLGLAPGYNVVSSGGDILQHLFTACDKGQMGFSQNRFHVGVTCPALAIGGKPYLTIRVWPVAMARWNHWRNHDRQRYRREKKRWGHYFAERLQDFVAPELLRHVEVMDVATPATYSRYSGSAVGSVYDMVPSLDNFARTRLPMKTPIRGLYHPKFVHGILGALYAGLQVVDSMLDGEIMGGRCMLHKR